jgi:predicted AAA+ superfamily ATPase
MPNITNSIVTIVGKKGTGKTSRIKEIIIEGNYQQIFVLDFLYEYSAYANDMTNVSNDPRFISKFCKESWGKCKTNIKSVMILDEIHLYGKNQFDINFVYRCGRHAKLDIIASAQRFYDLPVIVRSQTNRFDVFQITEPRDLDYLEKCISKDVLSTIQNLKTLEYVQLVI